MSNSIGDTLVNLDLEWPPRICGVTPYHLHRVNAHRSSRIHPPRSFCGVQRGGHEQGFCICGERPTGTIQLPCGAAFVEEFK